MNSLIYLLQVNLYLLLFYLFYLVLLRNETFFKLNRFYLVSSGILSLIIPVLRSPWVRELFVTERVYQAVGSVALINGNAAEQTSRGFAWDELLRVIYLAGVAVCLLILLIKLYRVSRILKYPGENQAFSFFGTVRVDENLPEKHKILEHEYVHVKQWHSADVIFFELLVAINWFNPVAYFYRNAAKNIHEFIADEEAAETDKASYAMLLLSNTFGLQPYQLTNSFFNQSILKRRIFMLHKTKSRRVAILKYALSAPLFAGMLILSAACTEDKTDKVDVKMLKKAQTKVGLTDLPPNALYILDEKEVSKKKFEDLTENRPDAIASIEVLKDQHATNIYGEKGKNGVIKILTKSFAENESGDKRLHNLGTLDVMPEFPGGMAKFYHFVADNYRYPEEATEKGVSGNIILSFVVEKNGSLTNKKFVRDQGLGTGEQAIEMLKKSPKWIPGQIKGKAVRVAYTLPIRLQLEVETGKTHK